MRIIVNFFKNILISVWVLVAIVATVCLISYNQYSVSEIAGNSIFVVDNERLEPDFKENDLVIIKKVAENKYNTGDRAFFYLSNPADSVFINYGNITKIVAAEHAEDTFYFGNDMVSYSDMIGLGHGAIVYHNWGLVLSIFESRWGFMFLVIFPTIFAIVYEIYSIIEEAKAARDED